MNRVVLLTTAEELLTNSRPGEALPFLIRAARAGGDRFFQADVLQRRGEALRSLSRFEEALRDYWAAHRLYRLTGVRSERLRTLLGASACLRVLSRYAQADRMWRSVSHLLPTFKDAAADPPAEEFKMEISLVRRGLGDLAGAIKMLNQTIPRLKKRAKADALQHAWWALAGAERFAGRYGRALKAYRRAAALAHRNRDRPAEAYANCGEAGCLRILGKGMLSLRLYDRAHNFFVREGDRFGEAYGLCGMGNALRTYGDPKKAVPLYRRSAALYARVGDEGSRAFALWGLGGSFRRMGRRDSAIRFYREALEPFKKVGDARGELMALLGLGRTMGETGRGAGAAAVLRRARSIALNKKHPYVAALARMELLRLPGDPAPAFLFRPFGVPASAVRRWMDLP